MQIIYAFQTLHVGTLSGIKRTKSKYLKLKLLFLIKYFKEFHFTFAAFQFHFDS